MRKARVIIFDDDLFILDILERNFLKRGYEVLTYNDPTTCPIYLDHNATCENKYPCADILITDYLMPRMNGVEFLKYQSQRGCKLDIKNKLIISGVILDENVSEFKELGCHFVRKPFKFSELTEWLAECEKQMDLSLPLSNI